MDTKDINLNSILSDITNFTDITLNDIPNLDLYMDQVTTLFESKLSSTKRNPEDKIMTKTMINNYAKAKIFPPIKSKKYNKNQIILLCLIYNLKQSLSLSDISDVFKPIVSNLSSKDKTMLSLEELYDTFLGMKQNSMDNFKNEFDELLNEIKDKTTKLPNGENEKSHLILLILMLIENANLNIRMSQKIIDSFFIATKDEGTK
ncbi:protein of unknown function [Clostridium acidisoli DSM 12555]|uniref:DUF1836 domain-containing protein n=1 Tax=Clostridium acidisoli DSM 12555 TaxID=1121291 RepID=A0A1W1X6M4_9CLOT|nr:DUF1836 domain-containing protein [Clostridium acidisoli]SMC19477.1 protein of unknown function [Clostridium acidisoli DSM 12555]